MRKQKEYSKKAISAMTVLWFAGALFGAIMVFKTNYDLSALLNYIGAPMTAGILGYLLKSAFENKEKIKKSSEKSNCEDGEISWNCPQADPLDNKGE